MKKRKKQETEMVASGNPSLFGKKNSVRCLFLIGNAGEERSSQPQDLLSSCLFVHLEPSKKKEKVEGGGGGGGG